MSNNELNKEIKFETEIDTSIADLSTTESIDETESINESLLSNFGDVEQEMDLTSEKLNELNKKLPSWSLEPPHSFIK